MNKFTIRFFLILCCMVALSCQKNDLTNEQTAKLYFKQLQTVLDQDNGDLWGLPMNAPTLFVNPLTREVFANQQDKEGLFTLDSLTGIYKGTFPMEKNPANSVVDLGGMKWVMAMWPLPEDLNARNVLLVHETFHYHQDTLGLSAGMNLSNHMDQYEARLWLKMEWNALGRAIAATDSRDRRQAIAQALQYRQNRRELYPDGVASENAYEILEGLPEYTAYTLCYPNASHRKDALLKLKDHYWQSESFIYSFAYYSGCAYGYLLDKENVDWRYNLKSGDDLAALFQVQPAEKDAEKDVTFGWDTIQAFELRRKARVDSIRTEYKNRFLNDSVLVLPLVNFGIGFTPATIQDLSPDGTVYPNIRITGDFGILELEKGGCLLSPDWTTATIPYTSALKNNWKLTLNEGFSVMEPTKDAPLKWTVGSYFSAK